MLCAKRYVPTGGALPAPDSRLLRNPPRCLLEAADGSNFCPGHRAELVDLATRRKPESRAGFYGLIAVGLLAIAAMGFLTACTPSKSEPAVGERCFIWIIQPDGSRLCHEWTSDRDER